jgi:hypothetical protein
VSVSYNASTVEIYSATNSLVRIEEKDNFFYVEKRSSLLHHWRCTLLYVNSEVVGLDPELRTRYVHRFGRPLPTYICTYIGTLELWMSSH